jgi:hypothetical protein
MHQSSAHRRAQLQVEWRFLSASVVRLGAMTELAVIPAWVVADHQQVADFNYMVFTLATELESGPPTRRCR